MKKLEFMQNLEINPKNQISTQLANQLTPLYLDENDNLEQRQKLITLYLNYYKFIIAQSEQEQSSYWEPACIITLNDNTILGDEPGFDTAQLQDDKILLEHPNEDGEAANEDEDCYYIIPLLDIQSIHFYFH